LLRLSLNCIALLFFVRVVLCHRSGGERGADIETLRGTHGPDFEGYATINRKGGGGISCGCFGGGDENDEKIILVKGAYCFVFGKESDPAPKYAVACAHMKAVTQSPSHGVHPVTIESALGDVDWELGFEKKELAEEFVDVFRKKAAEGEADEVRKVCSLLDCFIRPTLETSVFLPNPSCPEHLWSTPSAPWPRQSAAKEIFCKVRRVCRRKEIGRPTGKERKCLVGRRKQSRPYDGSLLKMHPAQTASMLY